MQDNFGDGGDDFYAALMTIHEELDEAQGASVNFGGYFKPDPAKVAAVMRPSATLNSIIG